MPNRREFCQALTLLSIAGVFEACTGGPTSPDANVPQLPAVNATLSGSTVALTVDSTSPLAAVGSAALVQTSGGSLLVAHTGTDTFTALTSVCTHQVCTITSYQGGTYMCPCHGSEFSTSGSVVRGPAFAPLRSFATHFAAPTLTITVA